MPLTCNPGGLLHASRAPPRLACSNPPSICKVKPSKRQTFLLPQEEQLSQKSHQQTFWVLHEQIEPRFKAGTGLQASPSQSVHAACRLL